MRRNKILFLVITLALLSLLTLGCSSEQTFPERVESGVIDKEYVGIPTAPVDQIYKLDDMSKENMMKTTGESEQQPDKAGESDEAKPKI